MPPLDPDLWRSVSPLLDRALEMDAEGRAALLSDVERERPDLADVLTGLLQDHERLLDSTFLESPPLPGEWRPSLAGQGVGAYTLDVPLGVGGMGTVWRARRSDGQFEGFVAIKLLNLALLDRTGQERFRREGTLLARLSHPNVARLLDAGVTATGQPYLVLEHVDGTRIDRFADERRLTVSARLELFLQVAEAVAHAHANLVLHRDLKPSNILVDAAGRVKLLDFGVGALLEEGSGDAPRTLTAAGRALTPEYAAPEQVTGGLITTATDVYALGVLLYQLLVDRHPTGSRDLGEAEMLRALLAHEPVRPSDVLKRSRAGDVDVQGVVERRSTTRDRLRHACAGDLDTIVGKALKKEPTARYSTVTAFADDIRRHLRNEPVTVRPDAMWYRTTKFVARHRLQLAAALAVVLALVAGTVVAVRQARASARERDRALEQLRRAEITNDFSAFLLSQARPTAKPISNKELLARGEALIEKRFAGDPALRVHMLLVLADRYFENQQFSDWRRVLQRAYEKAQTLDDVELRARAACHWAFQFAEQGHYQRALSLFESARATLPPRSELDHAEVEAGCLILEASAARNMSDGARAVRAAERAVALGDSRGERFRRHYEAVAVLARSYASVGRYADAERTFSRATAFVDREGLGSTVSAAILLNNRSANLQEMGLFLEAVSLSARAVEIARAADSENGASLTMLTTYGNALSATGDHAAAAVALDEAVRKARLAGSPRRLIFTLAVAIVAAFQAGDADRAAPLLAEARHALEADPSAYSRGAVEVSAARVAFMRGDYAEAVTMAERAATTFDAATPGKASLLATRILLAQSLNASHRFAEALAVAERCLADAKTRLAEHQRSLSAGSALVEIATARQGLGDQTRARQATDLALNHLLPSVGPGAVVTTRAMALREEGLDTSARTIPVSR